MKSSNILDDYISSFEKQSHLLHCSSMMYSNINHDTSMTSYGKSYDKVLTQSLLDDRSHRHKFSIDDIPTRESGQRAERITEYKINDSKQYQKQQERNKDSPKVLNFKQYYENSKLGLDIECDKTKRSKSNFERDNFIFQGSSRLGLKHDSQKSTAINYNINEYLPQSSKYGAKQSQPSVNTSAFLTSNIYQNQSTNVFKENLRPDQSLFSSQLGLSPKFFGVQPIYNVQQQCTCGANPLQRNSQLMLTQRSSCSCAYSQSQSSAGPSQYASPLSNCSKQMHAQHLNPSVSNFPKVHSSQSLINQQFNQINKAQSQSQAFVLQKPQSLITSNEATPIQTNNRMSYVQSHVNKSPIQQKSNLFEDRSISFLRSSDEKKKTYGGYNTDDLVRDSESEVDLNQVSQILKGVQMNFQEGFQNFVSKTSIGEISQQTTKASQIIEDERLRKEQLAMMILQGMNQQQQDREFNTYLREADNSVVNDSQIKTMKQNKFNKGPELTLDALQISQINQVQSTMHTPSSNFESNIQQAFQIDLNNQATAKPSRNIQPPQPNHLTLFQQQYQSPCFNSFEDSSLNIFHQIPNQQTISANQHKQISFQQSNSAISMSDQSNKQDQSSQSIISQTTNQVNQQQIDKSHKSKQPSRQTKNKQTKQLLKKVKKTFVNEESETPERSPYSDNSQREISPQPSQILTESNLKVGDQSNSAIIKVLREISIQNAQNDVSQMSNQASMQNKSDASCQYEPPSNEKKRSQLPPQQKRVQSLTRINQPAALPLKSLGGSIATSKNSTITPLNNHFRSQNPSNELEDYYLHLDDESQSQSYHTNALHINQHNQQSINGFIQPMVLSPYNMPQGYLDHFKSQCSEVIIRGSSETDISNKIQRFKNLRADNQSSGAFQSASNHHLNSNHQHQISDGQSLNQFDQNSYHLNQLNSNSRSQFTSIETHQTSPVKIISQKTSQRQIQGRPQEYLEKRDGVHAGDTFMNKHLILNQVNSNLLKTEEEEVQSETNLNDFNFDVRYQPEQLQGHFDNFQQQVVQTQSDDGNMQLLSQMHQNQLTVGNQTEEEFNYTIRLDEANKQTESSPFKPHGKQGASQKPPIPNYQGKQQFQFGNQFGSYHMLNNTGSTAGFPQLHGYQFSQQTGRENPSPSMHSSFHSQNNIIGYSNSQTSFSYINNSENTYDRRNLQPKKESKQKSQLKKKLSFMEKVVLIQRFVKDYLKAKGQAKQQEMIIQDERLMHQQFNTQDNSTIQKPGEDSLSNISAQLLNSLKQSLCSNLKGTKEIRPNEQTYQKNILESLNLTTGNTFVKETRHFNQGLIGRERTQGLNNSSAIVLYSGSTYDNRPNPFQGGLIRNSDFIMPGMISQANDTHPNYSNQQDYFKKEGSPNTSLLNLTEESNSGFFKLTPMGSQNVTQKTHQLQLHNQTSSHLNERTTESNNLNYSCSELESEWCNNIQKECSVSPMSVNTTSSKIKNLNGQRSGQRTGINQLFLFQRSGSIQSDQVHSNLNNQIRVEENIQSPLSVNQIPYSTKSVSNGQLTKQEQMLQILKSNDFDMVQPPNETQNFQVQSSQAKKQKEWKLLVPVKQNDLNNILMSLLLQKSETI